MVSQIVGVNQSIVDELGEPLNGSDRVSNQSDVGAVPGDLVQILMATDHIIYPPDEDGMPDPRNTIIESSRIGAGVSPMLEKSGRFSMALSPRPSGNARIFVRVFNSASLKEATHYGDSQLFMVSSLSNSLFLANITATDQSLRPQDSDNDGLSDSQEMSLGSDIFAVDSDYDGYTDTDEHVAGSDAMNEESFPLFTSIQVEGSGLTRLTWWPSVSGRTYRIYHSASLVGDENGMNLAAAVVSTDGTSSIVFTNSSLLQSGTFIFKVSK